MMIKKIAFLLSVCATLFCINTVVADDDFEDYEDYADYENTVQEDPGLEIDTGEKPSLNDDADFVNVNQFDISGIMLGMSYDDVYNLFFNNSSLYAPRKKNSIIYTVNKEWEYNLDYECRQNNVFIPDKLEKCIYSLARNRGLLYASEIHLEREYTGEKIDVFLTSNATDNKVWKIVYTNDVDEQEGVSERYENQREKKILAFWQGVLDKYGEPNSGQDKWISADIQYSPMMKAYYGQLVLEDQGLKISDDSQNTQKARENFQAKPYAF